MNKLPFRMVAFSVIALGVHLPAWSQIISTNTEISISQNITKDESMDFMQKIHGIHNVQLVTVILVPPDWESRVRLDETGLKEIGCTFTTRDPLHITGLISILEHADISIANTEDAWEQEPYEGIYLNLADGTKVKFLFGQKYINRVSVNGVFSHMPDIKKQFLVGKGTLPQDLAQWAARAATPVTKDTQTQLECEHYISNSKLK